ncbi:glycosyltransferase family 4 protein [Asanoa sp. WMMD1127]|uniref:glycosyltransferase family 4 protein n=1 Tax=Asanoa sp. WMMD1127 TaxID=3016107 RepID=UPI002416BA5F|nr:glycosyltransferase family 4 protein [Asanoa sp. WMMD1127]MDG4825205.1 glycosyltransferase family 4 protein [Asanoa sp. WMMD1127]
MRIAMVHSSFAVRGGAESYLRNLTAALRARGHEVRVFCRDVPGGEPADQRVRERLSTRFGARLPRLARKALVHLGDLVDPTGMGPRDLRAFAPDVVHVHNWQELGVLPVARIAAAYPTCHSVHDHAICDPNNGRANLGRSRALDALLGLRSRWIVRRLRRVTLLFAADRVRAEVRRCAPAATGQLLPLAVPLDWHRRGWPAARPDVFLFVGALTVHKGVDLLLDAWAAGAPGTLLIAGDGPLRDAVERAATATPALRYLGFVDGEAKRAAFAQAGWLVFPSRGAETYGLVCAEALMAGRPIIASASATPPMAADTSMLVFHDPAELAGLLKTAAAMSPAEHGAFSASAAADGRRLDWDDHVDGVLRAYESVRG